MGEFAIDGITISTPKVIEKVEVKTGETIYLTDLSVGEPDSWLWNFPGGTPSRQHNKIQPFITKRWYL